jgi:tetratricopeptide (TPR) repeat protein
MKIKIVILTAILVSQIFAQEASIVEHLKSIEDGNVESAIAGLTTLKRTHPNDPSVIFLDAVLTEDGESALQKYSALVEQHPQSNYADAALYRVFSYYYSLGAYKRAEDLLTQLKSNYPNSPYIRAADRTIPDEGDGQIETTPTAVQPEQNVKANEKYNFTIQAGAFLNIDNAQSLVNAIIADGYPADLGTKSVGGSILNVVTFGHLQSENDAVPLLTYLKNKFDLNGRVISAE